MGKLAQAKIEANQTEAPLKACGWGTPYLSVLFEPLGTRVLAANQRKVKDT